MNRSGVLALCLCELSRPMTLAQAGTADIQDRDHDHPVIAGFLNDSSDLKEMNIDVLGEDSKNCHEGPHLDQLPDEKEDGVEGDEADRSGLSSYLFTSSQPVSPNTITLAPAHARSSTPISPDYEDLISDEDEVGFGPLSPLETLPTEVSLLFFSIHDTNAQSAGSVYRHTNKLRPGLRPTCFDKPNLCHQAQL